MRPICVPRSCALIGGHTMAGRSIVNTGLDSGLARAGSGRREVGDGATAGGRDIREKRVFDVGNW